jgi:hypothetical protein
MSLLAVAGRIHDMACIGKRLFQEALQIAIVLD